MLFMIRGMRGDCIGSSISSRAIREQRLGDRELKSRYGNYMN